MALPPAASNAGIDPKTLYIHPPMGRRGRAIDNDTERFVDDARKSAATAAPS